MIARVLDMGIASRVKCTLQRVQAVAMKHKCHSSHETTDQSIVAIVSNRKKLAVQAIVVLAGSSQTVQSQKNSQGLISP
jgi:predicted metal-dependent enzyme (double-stranded beta helix superfamily)